MWSKPSRWDSWHHRGTVGRACEPADPLDRRRGVEQGRSRTVQQLPADLGGQKARYAGRPQGDASADAECLAHLSQTGIKRRGIPAAASRPRRD